MIGIIVQRLVFKIFFCNKDACIRTFLTFTMMYIYVTTTASPQRWKENLTYFG